MSAAAEQTVDDQSVPSQRVPKTRILYWCVRRELWENRSIYVAPLVVVSLVLLGTLINGLTTLQRVTLLPGPEQAAMLARRYDVAAISIMLISLLVAAFYCLGALHGERRDRSILFWKSLPVSDLTTVMAKASIPIVLMPLFVFTVILTTQLIMLMFHTTLLLAYGGAATALWTDIPWFQKTVLLFYSLIAFSLWYAPIYAWLLMVSAWAGRAPFLWAMLPPLMLGIAEKLAFDSIHLGALLQDRFIGVYAAAFKDATRDGDGIDRLSELDPVKFLSSPGLWEGLAAAVAFLAAAIWLRRYRQPI